MVTTYQPLESLRLGVTTADAVWASQILASTGTILMVTPYTWFSLDLTKFLVTSMKGCLKAQSLYDKLPITLLGRAPHRRACLYA